VSEVECEDVDDGDDVEAAPSLSFAQVRAISFESFEPFVRAISSYLSSAPYLRIFRARHIFRE